LRLPAAAALPLPSYSPLRTASAPSYPAATPSSHSALRTAAAPSSHAVSPQMPTHTSDPSPCPQHTARGSLPHCPALPSPSPRALAASPGPEQPTSLLHVHPAPVQTAVSQSVSLPLQAASLPATGMHDLFHAVIECVVSHPFPSLDVHRRPGHVLSLSSSTASALPPSLPPSLNASAVKPPWCRHCAPLRQPAPPAALNPLVTCLLTYSLPQASLSFQHFLPSLIPSIQSASISSQPQQPLLYHST